jgi:predicted Zn-dependent peptidase
MTRLSNGVTSLYQSNPSLPLAAGTLLLRTGSIYEQAEQAGLANLTVDLLLQGSRRRSAQQIADVIESIGASIGTQTSDDYVEIGWTAPAQKLETVLEVVMDLLIHPLFSSKEIAKEKAHGVASLKSRNDTLFTVAHDQFNTFLFGDHPYGRPVEGRIETLSRFNRRHLQDWHHTYFDPHQAIVSIVAPQPMRVGQALIEKYFLRWKAPRRPAQNGAAPSVALLKKPQRANLKATFEQAYLMTGMQAPSISEAGYAALKVLNVLFGGGMSSRLFLELREKMGLAYEVSSFFPTRLQKSQWVLYMGLPPEKLDVAREKMNAMLDALGDQKVLEKEVHQAKEMIRGSFLMENQTRRRQAWSAAWGAFLGKGPDFSKQFLRQIDLVTREDIHKIAKKLLGEPRVTVEVTPP